MNEVLERLDEETMIKLEHFLEIVDVKVLPPDEIEPYLAFRLREPKGTLIYLPDYIVMNSEKMNEWIIRAFFTWCDSAERAAKASKRCDIGS